MQVCVGMYWVLMWEMKAKVTSPSFRAVAAAAAMLTLLLQVIPEDVRATVLNLFR